VKAAATILKRHGCEGLLRTVLQRQTRLSVRQLRRGRPRAGNPVREERRVFYRLEFAPDEEGLRRQARTDGVFPLVTNLPASPYSKNEVLLITSTSPTWRSGTHS
jgi:hypothetical protein